MISSRGLAHSILLGRCLSESLHLSVFQAFYTTDWLKQNSASDFSWIGSVQLFLELACGPNGGKLFDAGHCRITIFAGSALFLLGFSCHRSMLKA